jgi:hypothetical protein
MCSLDSLDSLEILVQLPRGRRRRALVERTRYIAVLLTRDGVPPSCRASVHSSVTMRRIPFFFAMHVTDREPKPSGLLTGVVATNRCVPKKDERSCIVLMSTLN